MAFQDCGAAILFNRSLSFFFHYKIFKKNPLSFYLLFLNNFIACFIYISKTYNDFIVNHNDTKIFLKQLIPLFLPLKSNFLIYDTTSELYLPLKYRAFYSAQIICDLSATSVLPVIVALSVIFSLPYFLPL